MIMDNSPIIDYYPVEFEQDLNGKQQAWEAVVLIPFIDEVSQCWPQNLKAGIRSLFDPVLTLRGVAILTIMYGDELLYLRIWRNHSM